ncbi:MAG: hypothetical protein C4292_03040 [Nitrososphaera sp.]
MIVAQNELNAHQVWKAVLGELQMQMPRATFDTWVKNTSVVSYEDGAFVIGVPNTYAVEWLENRLLGTIKRSVTTIMRRSVNLRFVVKPSIIVDSEPAMPLHTQTIQDDEDERRAPLSPSTVLNPKYTFGARGGSGGCE